MGASGYLFDPALTFGCRLADELLAALPLCDLAAWLLPQTGRTAKLLGDLRDLIRGVVRSEHRRLGGQVVRRHALRRLVDHDELARLGVRTVEHRSELVIIARREPVEAEVIAALTVRLALRNLLRGDARAREELRQIGPGEPL